MCTGRCMCHAQLRNSYEEDYVVAMVRKLLRRPRHVPRRRRRDRAGRHGASHRRPRQRTAERGGEDQARPRGARVRRDASLSAPRRGADLPDHLQLAEVLEGYETLKRLAPSRAAHRAGPRSRGDEDLSGGEAGPGGLGGAARRRAEGLSHALRAVERRARRTHSHVMLRRFLREAAEHRRARCRARRADTSRTRTVPTAMRAARSAGKR